MCEWKIPNPEFKEENRLLVLRTWKYTKMLFESDFCRPQIFADFFCKFSATVMGRKFLFWTKNWINSLLPHKERSFFILWTNIIEISDPSQFDKTFPLPKANSSNNMSMHKINIECDENGMCARACMHACTCTCTITQTKMLKKHRLGVSCVPCHARTCVRRVRTVVCCMCGWNLHRSLQW